MDEFAAVLMSGILRMTLDKKKELTSWNKL